MMARIGRRIRFLLHRGRELRSRATLAMALMLGVGLSLAAPSRSDAAKLSSFLTPQDLARPILLDQNGQQIQLPSSHHSHPVFPQGSTPTYLVIPLSGGEHLPAGITTIFTGQGGTAIGPLDFNATVKAKVDSALDTSRFAVAETPSRSYFIEFLPRVSHFLPRSSTGMASAPPAQAGGAGTSTTQATGSAALTSKVITNSSSNELSQFLGGTLSIGQLAKNSLTDLENLLHIKSSKRTARKPSLNLEAQVIDPPLPAPIPEPSTWLIFGLILGTAGLHQRLRQGVGRSA